MKSDNVKALLMLAAAGAVVYVGYRAYKTGSDALSSVGNLAAGVSGAVAGAVNAVVNVGANAIDSVKVAATAVGVNYAQELTPSAEPYGIYLTAQERQVAETYRPFGGWVDRLFNTDWAANDARREFAATDPRRVDL